ncbi:MAG: YggS family pyridoxal phosphate-dependent enzyme [Enhygromyxa sp.]
MNEVEPALEGEIAGRLAAVRARIAAAVERRGPGPELRLIGVSKRQPLDKLLAAHAAGLRDFGENYAQELRDKQRDWPAELEANWHYIGALQTNKLKYLVGKTALIHTVDRPELIAAIDQRAARMGVVQPFLIEVGLAGEQQKAGVAPERIPELLDACAQSEHGAARCEGLMIIPPAAEDPEQTRRWFRDLRQLVERLREGPERANVELRELSMGMSADFEIAIEEGATLVRVGTSIFGERQ